MTDTRALLAAERVDALERIDALARDVSEYVESASSTTGDDEHDPEGATVGYERAQAIALLSQARDRLAAVDAALEGLATGRYGRCRSCGDRIDPARLDARPSAPHCLACAR